MADAPIKCVVWDLDNTVWDGVLMEDPSLSLKPEIPDIIRGLDDRGILQSVASRNESDIAMAKLRELGLDGFFLYPQIHWHSKADSIARIAARLNIGTDTFAFVDDDPVELAEVAHSFPEVLCINADRTPEILEMPRMIPPFSSPDQKKRRSMYQADMERDEAEDRHDGSREGFLASLDMVLTIFPAGEGDLERAEELTVRTNQLNATGLTYSRQELDEFRRDPQHLLLMAKLEDRYGDYGRIGLAMLECQSSQWTIKLLLTSCRVMSRGVGSILLSHLINDARSNRAALFAEFVPTDRNRMMRVAYQFSGFVEADSKDEVITFRHPLEADVAFPEYMNIVVLRTNI